MFVEDKIKNKKKYKYILTQKGFGVFLLFVLVAIIIGYQVIGVRALTQTVDVLNGDGDFENPTPNHYSNWTSFTTSGTAPTFSQDNLQKNTGTYSAKQSVVVPISTGTSIAGYKHTFTTPKGTINSATLGFWLYKTVSSSTSITFNTKWEVCNSSETATIASGTIESSTNNVAWTQYSNIAVTGLAGNTTYKLKIFVDATNTSGFSSRTLATNWDNVVLNVNYTDNPPTVAMSSPTDLSNQKGTIALKATSTDDGGTAAVTFEYANNTGFTGATAISGATIQSGTNTNGTWGVNWNTSSLNGPYYVRAKADDGINTQVTSGTYYTYYLDNIAPSAATVTSPANSSTNRGTINLTANAQDNISVNSVDFQWADNTSFTGATTLSGATMTSGSSTNGTWTKSSVNTATMGDGTRYIRAIVTDTAGNVTTGSYITVSVDNTAPSFSVNYYSDAGLTIPLPTFNSKPITKANVPVYIKVTPNETLATSPTISIDAPGTANDRTNVTPVISGGSYVYTWNTVKDVDGDTNITVSGTDTVGNASTNAVPTSGGTVTIDSTITAPTLSATSGGFLVNLSWTTQADDKQYSIYRSTTNGFTADGSSLIATVSAPASSYPDTGLTQGITYYYKIIVTDYAGNISNASNQISGVPTEALLETDSISFTSVKGSNNQVSLKWSNPGGADYFELQRSTDGENFSVLVTGTTLTTYDDNSVQNYIDYYYKIFAKASTVTVASDAAHVFPPDSSPHGNYRDNTALCASCHITHAAQGGNLIKAASKTTLCTSCHDGTQSKYNVLKGEVRVPDAGYYATSSAGLFGLLNTGVGDVNTQVPYNYTNGVVTAGTIPVNPTSIHNLGTIISDAPGENINIMGAKDTVLECNTCHDPHNTSNFRMLKLNLGTSYGEAVNDVQAYAKTVINGGSSNDAEVVTYRSGSIYFCGYCHSDFNQGTGSGHMLAKTTKQSGFDISNDSYDKVMHAVGINPLYSGTGAVKPTDIPYENDGVNGDKIMCLTCHKAHGTTATGTAARRNAQQSTVLKRKDGALLCEGCHNKTNYP